MNATTLLPAMTEAQLQQTIIEACDVLGLPVFHIRDSRRNMGEGFPDLCIADWRAGVVRFWELKTERGRTRPRQQEWLSLLTACRDVDVQIIRPVHLDWALERLTG